MRFEGRVWRYVPRGAHPLDFEHLIRANGRWRWPPPDISLSALTGEGDEQVLAIYPENDPQRLDLRGTEVRYPLNYGEDAVLDPRDEFRIPPEELGR